MEPKSTILENRLLKYSLAAGTILAIAPSATAQIIYTNPADQSGTSQTFNINFDGDGDTEITIKFGLQAGVASSDIRVNGTTGMRMVAYYNFINWYGRALAANYTIGPASVSGATAGFANNQFGVLVYSSIGPWVNQTSKYLGVKFKIGANTHYGWIRMSISGNNNFSATLYDYAYESTPNLGIKAGETTTSLPVELKSFSAIQLDNAVKLLWETATEVNNYGFNVERKTENGAWNEIGFVDGHGNSNSPKSYEYTDNLQFVKGNYIYRLKQMDTDGGFEYSDEVKVTIGTPDKFALKQNYPNPFNPTTNIKFNLPESGLVNLTVYNTLGQEVAVLLNQQMEAGNYEQEFNASDLPSGIYIYKIIAGNFVESRKMMLLK